MMPILIKVINISFELAAGSMKIKGARSGSSSSVI